MIRMLAQTAALTAALTAAGAAFAHEPAPRIAPSLAAHTAEFAPPKVYEPAPGIFSAVGYGIANSIMVVGKTGVVIIDTTDSLDEAKKVWEQFAPHAGGKPIVGVIYTHNHNDHINGARGFPVSDGAKIIAHDTLLREAAKWNGVAAPAIAARAARMYGVFLPKGTPDGFVSVGIGPYLSAFGGGGAGGFIPPNTVFSDRLEITLGGEEFVLEHAPGETEDQILVWMPGRKVLFPGDNIYKAFPNLYTIRGTSYRDPVQWADSIDRMRALNPEVLVPSHTRPIVGAPAIATELTNYRDAIRFTHDQTVRWMNQGLTPDEIVERVKLPAHGRRPVPLRALRDSRVVGALDLRRLHGLVRRRSGQPVVRCAGRAREEVVDTAGGAAPALAAAQKAFDEGRWKWTAELTGYVGRADAALKPQADVLQAKAFRQLGYDSVSPNGRNYYLERAAELEKKAPGWAQIIGARQGGSQAAGLPAAAVVATFPVRLNAEKAAGAQAAMGLKLTGDGDWTIRVRRGVAETPTGVAADVPLVVAAAKADWVGALASPGAMQAALTSGKVKIEKGDPAALASFLDLFRG